MSCSRRDARLGQQRVELEPRVPTPQRRHGIMPSHSVHRESEARGPDAGHGQSRPAEVGEYYRATGHAIELGDPVCSGRARHMVQHLARHDHVNRSCWKRQGSPVGHDRCERLVPIGSLPPSESRGGAVSLNPHEAEGDPVAPGGARGRAGNVAESRTDIEQRPAGCISFAWATDTSTSGGCSETDATELAVIPSGRPAGSRVVTTVTPVAKQPSSWRNRAGSTPGGGGGGGGGGGISSPEELGENARS